MPAETRLRIDGIEEAVKVLAAVPKAVKAAIGDAATTMRNLALGRTPYRTGHLKRGWGAVRPTAKGFSFSNPVEYAGILEEGLYPSVGPRTIALAGGIYSRQAPGGMLTPLLENEEILNRVLDVIVRSILEGLTSGRT